MSMTQHDSTTPECLTTRQLSERLQVSESQIEKARCTKSLDIPYIRIGKSIRYPVRQLDTWISANLVKAERPAMILGVTKPAEKKDN